MKKNLIKKVFAVSLSIAMACSALPAANPVTASAAAPYVSLKTTFKTLKVGQSYKMTLKNNTISWKIKKVETTDKPTATVYGKTTSSVMIKGKSVGRATIRVRLQTSKRKTKNTKTLRCRVNVVSAAQPTTPDPVAPTQTEATVTTQQQLTDALAVTSIKKITIKPTDAVNFVIPSGSYNDVDLIVDAPQSEIENSATFKSITVENIKPATFTEKAAGNTFNWKAANGRLVIAKGASVRSVSIPTTNAKVTIDIQEGTLGTVNVSAKIELNITGTLATGAAAVNVSFTAAATDASITTAIKTAITTAAKIAAIFANGAEDSTIKLETAGISVAVTNNTTKAIVVTRNDNTTLTVSIGAQNQTISAISSSNGSTTYPGSSSGNGTTSDNRLPAVNSVVTGSGIVPKAIVNVTSGSAVISSGSISFEMSNFKTRVSSPAALEYSIYYLQNNGTYGGSVKDWTTMDVVTDTSGRTESYKANVTASLNGFKTNQNITFVISVRVKATSVYKASDAVQAKLTFNIPEGVLEKHEISTTLQWQK